MLCCLDNTTDKSGSNKRHVVSIVLGAAGSRLGRYCLGGLLARAVFLALPYCPLAVFLLGILPVLMWVRKKGGREADSRREEERKGRKR